MQEYILAAGIRKQVEIPKLEGNLHLTVDKFAGGGFSLDSMEGIAASVYITAANLLNKLPLVTDKMPQNWSMKKPLMIYPFAGRALTANYNRHRIAFFYDMHPVDKNWFFTSAHSDIVAHELGHAILDALRPDLWNAASIEIWAFHEAFADSLSMLATLQHDEVIDHIIQSTGGDLSKNNVASDIAESFSRILSHKKQEQNPNYLRSAINQYSYIDPKLLPKSKNYNELSREPHNFSRIFFGAVYDIMKLIYDHRRNFMSETAALADARNITANYLLKAASFAPISTRFYESVAKTMLWLDYNRGRPYHDGMRDIFARRNILLPSDLPRVRTNEKAMNGVVQVIEPRVLSTKDIEIAIPKSEGFLFDRQGELVNYHAVSDQESIASGEDFLEYLQNAQEIGDDSAFKLKDGKLVRVLMDCCSGSRKPLKSSPEYDRQYKPENNAGCGCKKPRTETPTKQKAKRGCYVRYKTGS